MAKIEVSAATEILKKHKLDPKQLREIVEEMNALTQPKEGEDEKPPAAKKQFVILLADQDGKLAEQKDITGWVLQIPEEDSPSSAVDRILKGAYDFNASKKGRLLPVKTVGEALESVGAKFFKESDLWVKTKLPVMALRTDNVLPKGEFSTEKVDRRRRDDAV